MMMVMPRPMNYSLSSARIHTSQCHKLNAYAMHKGASPMGKVREMGWAVQAEASLVYLSVVMITDLRPEMVGAVSIR